uniref:Uncharacterized protein n=1 Tax=Amphimedon queenslandica TaxID=400682 RepID=A0A1X7UUJ8_AMPQE
MSARNSRNDSDSGEISQSTLIQPTQPTRGSGGNADENEAVTLTTLSSFSSTSSVSEAGSTITSYEAQAGIVLDDIASSTSSPPCQQVINGKFPVTYFFGKVCSFNLDWYKLYPCLEYSIKKDAAFCYPC